MIIHRSPFLGPTRGCRIPTLAVGLLLLLVTSGATAQSGPTAPDERWITIGADAFDALVRNPTFQFGSLPLQKEAQRDAVVLTRVHDSDIVAISQRIHERLNRCAGFLAHSSLEEAWEALEAATVPLADRLEADYIIDQPLLVAGMKSLLSEAPILETIGHLSQDFNNRFYAHPSGAAAAQWIYDLWEGYAGDRTDVTVELFDHPWAQSSVILTIQGSLYPDEVVILGGHLDSIAPGSNNPSFLAPGADDNASGIAALSEVLRAAMALGFQPQKTVKF
ncbi:MAG: M28 family peptidase, partial [Acidobacteria bacterium]|nr:M28 family peptidase [Acidobacteriota bacterium]